MSNEEAESLRYNFDFAGGAQNSYLFETVNNVLYEVQFIPTPYLFGENFVLADKLVELIIKVADNPNSRRPPLDPLVAPTIASIIGDFYRKSSLTVTLFMCDAADRRHKARWRKFNSWYVHFGEHSYRRFDDTAYDAEKDITYHCAILIKHSNPYIREVSLAFIDFMVVLRDGK